MNTESARTQLKDDASSSACDGGCTNGPANSKGVTYAFMCGFVRSRGLKGEGANSVILYRRRSKKTKLMHFAEQERSAKLFG